MVLSSVPAHRHTQSPVMGYVVKGVATGVATGVVRGVGVGVAKQAAVRVRRWTGQGLALSVEQQHRPRGVQTPAQSWTHTQRKGIGYAGNGRLRMGCKPKSPFTSHHAPRIITSHAYLALTRIPCPISKQ